MLEALAMNFDLRPNFFSDMIQEGNSVLRAIHYPPLEEGRTRPQCALPSMKTST